MMSRMTTRRDWKLKSADYQERSVNIALYTGIAHGWSLTMLGEVVVYKFSQLLVPDFYFSLFQYSNTIEQRQDGLITITSSTMQTNAGSPDREANVECHSDTAVRMTMLYRPKHRFVTSAVLNPQTFKVESNIIIATNFPQIEKIEQKMAEPRARVARHKGQMNFPSERMHLYPD